jgi:hypothetical protein
MNTAIFHVSNKTATSIATAPITKYSSFIIQADTKANTAKLTQKMSILATIEIFVHLHTPNKKLPLR